MEMKMTDWTKREFVVSAAAIHFTDIWDTEGWQINKTNRDTPEPFLLIDTNMPHWVPASSVMGHFATLEAAQAEAQRIGTVDWSGAEGVDALSP